MLHRCCLFVFRGLGCFTFVNVVGALVWGVFTVFVAEVASICVVCSLCVVVCCMKFVVFRIAFCCTCRFGFLFVPWCWLFLRLRFGGFMLVLPCFAVCAVFYGCIVFVCVYGFVLTLRTGFVVFALVGLFVVCALVSPPLLHWGTLFLECSQRIAGRR